MLINPSGKTHFSAFKTSQCSGVVERIKGFDKEIRQLSLLAPDHSETIVSLQVSDKRLKTRLIKLVHLINESQRMRKY